MVRRLTMSLIVPVAVLCGRTGAQEPHHAADSVSQAPASMRFDGLRDSVYFVIDKAYGRARIIGPGDTVNVPAGNRTLRLYDRDSVSLWEDITVVPGSFVTLRVRYRMPSGADRWSPFPRMYWRANVVVMTDSASDIYVDGRRMGRGIAWLDTLPGTYTVRTFHALSGRSSVKEFTADERLTSLRLYNKPATWVANMLSVVPGARQIYRGEDAKGKAFLVVSVLTWGAAAYHHGAYLREWDRYVGLRELYGRAASEAEAMKFGYEASKARDVAAATRDRRARAVAAGLAVFVVHIVDMILAPDLDARVTIPFDPYDIPPGSLRPDDVRMSVGWRIGGR